MTQRVPPVSPSAPQTPFTVRGQRKHTLPRITRDKTTRDETPARAGYTLGGHLPPLLSSADELALCARIQAGDRDARNELVEANIRLARRCASLFLASRRTIGALTLDDLTQEALLGVIRAAERYDGRGRFSTVAVWWIKQSLSRALDAQAEMIRVPTYVATAHKKVRSRMSQLENTGQPVTRRALAALGVSEHEIDVMRLRPPSALSYDRATYVEDAQESSMRDLLPDPTDMVDPIAQEIDSAALIDWIKRTLDARAWAIFAARVFPDEPIPYHAIGPTVGVTPERARQLMQRAHLTLIAKGLCPDGAVRPNAPRAREAAAEIKRIQAESIARFRVAQTRRTAKRAATRAARRASQLERSEVSG